MNIGHKLGKTGSFEWQWYWAKALNKTRETTMEVGSVSATYLQYVSICWATRTKVSWKTGKEEQEGTGTNCKYFRWVETFPNDLRQRILTIHMRQEPTQHRPHDSLNDIRSLFTCPPSVTRQQRGTADDTERYEKQYHRLYFYINETNHLDTSALVLLNMSHGCANPKAQLLSYDIRTVTSIPASTYLPFSR